MNSWDWNGSRWWRFDFHSHSPASSDYGKGEHQAQLRSRTPRQWLLDQMAAGIDCATITDHNTGVWIDQLQKALSELSTERPAGFRPVILFPGVEISVNGGIHVLAILSPGKTTADVDSLLGAVGYSGTKGSSDAVTSKSFAEVVSEVARAGGLAIPAHADQPDGLFRLVGQTLAHALRCREIIAMEIGNTRPKRPALYESEGIRWAEIAGSDSHHPSGDPGQRFPGSTFTWVKMGSPSLEGLRLALLDGILSLRRSDLYLADPNERGSLAIESIEVNDARYVGRARPFTMQFNPWLNAVIGGRGTGKSTLLEFLRMTLRRDREVPTDLQAEFEKYRSTYLTRNDPGLLTDQAIIRVVYRKNGSRFRIQWSPTMNIDPIQEEDGGAWKLAEGDVSQRFPVRLYSQKQVFHLAKEPLALLGIVDEAPEVDRHSWDQEWLAEQTRFLSLRARARELEPSSEEDSRLRGELDDVIRKIGVFEESHHADVLKTFQSRTRQQKAIDTWEEGWAAGGDQLRSSVPQIVPEPLTSQALDPTSKVDQDLLSRAAATVEVLGEIGQDVNRLAARVDSALADWGKAKGASPWKTAVDAAVTSYESLVARLANEGVTDPRGYGDLVLRRHAIELGLANLAEHKEQAAALREQAEDSLIRLREVRRTLTQRRHEFLAGVLRDNKYVSIRVLPYRAKETVEGELRALLHREDGSFERDIGSPNTDGLLGSLYVGDEEPASIEHALAAMKSSIGRVARGEVKPADLRDARFATHVGRLQPEALDRIETWYPEDSLDVQYSSTSDGERFRSIEEASPGQKTAALLAFLLSYGEEPLLLDQPEDDLDNHLIYALIVTQIREAKSRRQIVVVTHNANIVVNGDAELVVALEVQGGETHLECEGSLQQVAVRDTICSVLEGGRDALEQRYRRITLSDQ
jgi:ABC-type enterochelin transport system ATPase subunit/PHP family Zn ribbon phosphoesterase